VALAAAPFSIMWSISETPPTRAQRNIVGIWWLSTGAAGARFRRDDDGGSTRRSTLLYYRWASGGGGAAGVVK
jgi:hypothetical protein